MEVTAKGIGNLEGDEDMSLVLGEFEHWRAQRRSKRDRIPEQLWERAASMARRHGVNRVAALLHLAHGGLGRRVALASGGQPPVRVEPNAPQFVELFAPAVASASSPVPAAECVVDLVNVRGMKMRVVLNGTGVAGLSALCQAFCAAG